MYKYHLHILFILFTSQLFSNSIVMHGKVIDATNNPIEGVNIFSNNIGTTSNQDGYFSITVPKESLIFFEHIGYKTVKKLSSIEFLLVRMNINILEGKNINISASKIIPGVTPVAFSSLTEKEIKNNATLEDVPMILSYEPSIYSYSESGNGTGYSYVSIRGFDQTEIAVMIDNVPMNDNESHQVYWADHGNILNDVKEVEVQRGIGNSMYGAAAFGGSINVHTKIKSSVPKIQTTLGIGSFNSIKKSVSYNSGENLGKNLGINLRLSQIDSDGYRDYHKSKQNAISFGLEYSNNNWINQFRILGGHLHSDLTWWGIDKNIKNDRKMRKTIDTNYLFTDDFLQQVYSINTTYTINKNSMFKNTLYYVKGEGYYETTKSDASFYKYNLDFENSWANETTNLLRKKWLKNNYIGIAPSYSIKLHKLRINLGGEYRIYEGDHFGEVSNFTNPLLSNVELPYKYYQYIGKKYSTTAYIHSTYSINNQLTLFSELQYVNHSWKMEQEKIGHAEGHNIHANWSFLNPRIGFNIELANSLSIYSKVGISQKEPKDDQIINADEWEFQISGAYPQKINDFEFGLSSSIKNINILLNIYQIHLKNELIENIDFENQGQYIYSQADKTIHEGIELDLRYYINKKFTLNWNGMLSHNYFDGGIFNNKYIPKGPNQLSNLSIEYCSDCTFNLYTSMKYVGKQYIDNANTHSKAIDPYYIVNIGTNYSFENITLSGKINNLFNTLYITHGDDSEWGAVYWPGSTISLYLELQYQF